MVHHTIMKRYRCVSPEPRRRQVRNIAILPDRQFLDAQWDGEFAA